MQLDEQGYWPNRAIQAEEVNGVYPRGFGGMITSETQSTQQFYDNLAVYDAHPAFVLSGGNIVRQAPLIPSRLEHWSAAFLSSASAKITIVGSYAE